MSEVFTIGELCRVQPGMTVSRNAKLGSGGAVTYYALAAGTDISAESYDWDTLYIAAAGIGELYDGTESAAGNKPDAAEKRKTQWSMRPGMALLVPAGTNCGKRTADPDGFVYVEVILKGEQNMNTVVKPGEVFALKDLVNYQEDGIANLDVVNDESMKFSVLAFDAGTALPEHRAPGDAIVFALEGKAVIGYEGREYPIEAGQNFRFAKNGLHSVRADGRFKMALLLVRK